MTIESLMYALLTLPLLFSIIAVSGVVRNKYIHILNKFVGTAVGILFIAILFEFDPSQGYAFSIFYLDSLSIILLLTLVVLYVATAWITKGYLLREKNYYKFGRGYLSSSPNLIGRYYALTHAFMWTMIFVISVENLGLMWVGIEATTLVSALLVSFKCTRSALEATWKYIMVCTVGICLALLGTIILYYAQLGGLGSEHALSWTYLSSHALSLDPSFVKLAFLFIFIGYGTKIGLAPMHTWLPDVYSEAPSLISGLLSGALCSCAIYVMMRNLAIIVPVVGVDFVSKIILFFGIITLLIAIPFVLIQRDLKRLLAYSSMENIAIMMLGVGIFSVFSVKAALFHLLNHAFIKFTLFYTAGTIIQEYNTKNIMRIHGMIKETPRTATILLMGMFAILGMPPFGLFVSKFAITFEMFRKGHYVVGTLLVVLVAGVVIGILYHIMRISSDKATLKACGDLFDKTDLLFLGVLLCGSIGTIVAIMQSQLFIDVFDNAAKIVVGGVL